MKPVIRYQSQLLFRKCYKPNRLIRIRPTETPNFVFRPMRRFVKPHGVGASPTLAASLVGLFLRLHQGAYLIELQPTLAKRRARCTNWIFK